MSPCQFLELPAELRNRIYELVLTTPEESITIVLPEELPVFGPRTESEDRRYRRRWRPRRPFVESIALVRTCKQIADEATGVLYGMNHFLIETKALVSLRHAKFRRKFVPDPETWARRTWQWIDNIGTRNLRRLKQVTIDMQGIMNESYTHLQKGPSLDRLLQDARKLVTYSRASITHLDFRMAVDFLMGFEPGKYDILEKMSYWNRLRIPASSRSAAAKAVSDWTREQVTCIRLAETETDLPPKRIAMLRAYLLRARGFMDLLLYVVMQ